MPFPCRFRYARQPQRKRTTVKQRYHFQPKLPPYHRTYQLFRSVQRLHRERSTLYHRPTIRDLLWKLRELRNVHDPFRKTSAQGPYRMWYKRGLCGRTRETTSRSGVIAWPANNCGSPRPVSFRGPLDADYLAFFLYNIVSRGAAGSRISLLPCLYHRRLGVDRL